MKGLDTNVIVRFLVGDHPEQSQKVYNLFKLAEQTGKVLYVPLLVLLEVIWVLESAYHIPRKDVIESISDLASMPILKFESERVVWQFLAESSNCNNDLSDILIGCAARDAGCEAVMTFDKKAARMDLFELVQ